MDKHLFKTAEFAALCGVKKDTLLHYDHIGLLKPQRVGENGYRYYSARQLATYDLISALRRLDTPLSEIRDYLTRRSPEALLELLEEKEAALEAERKRLERMGSLLRETIRTTRLAREVQPGEIRLEELPAAAFAVVKAPRFQEFEESVYLLHIRELLTWSREQGSGASAPGDIFCRENLDREEVREDFYFCPVEEGTQGWPIHHRPPGTYAVLYHQGSYQSEYEAIRRLRDWVRDQGYEIDGDLYEEDLVNYTTSEDPDSYLLKLSVKIKEKEDPRMTLDITKITQAYTVKRLGEEDFPAILALYGSNPQYFAAMNQPVPEGGLEEDLEAVPAGKTLEDKYWLGFWQEETLAATLELVTSYPEENTAYIGLFMMDAARQGQGEGSRLMADLFAWLKEGGFAWVELSYSYGNPQSEGFWFKNGFFPTGAMRQMEDYVAISLQKHL